MHIVQTPQLKPIINHPNAHNLQTIAKFMTQNMGMGNERFSSLEKMMKRISQRAKSEGVRFLKAHPSLKNDISITENKQSSSGIKIASVSPLIQVCETNINQSLVSDEKQESLLTLYALILKTYHQAAGVPETRFKQVKTFSEMSKQIAEHFYKVLDANQEINILFINDNETDVERILVEVCFVAQNYYNLPEILTCFNQQLKPLAQQLLESIFVQPSHSYLASKIEFEIDEHDPDNFESLADAESFLDLALHFSNAQYENKEINISDTPNIYKVAQEIIKATQYSQDKAELALREIAQASTITFQFHSEECPYEYLSNQYGQYLPYPEIILCPDQKSFDFCEFYQERFDEPAGYLIASAEVSLEEPAKAIAKESMIMKNLLILDQMIIKKGR